MIEEVAVQCPHCGETFTAIVDCSAGSQEYVEDCEVCCQPIVFRAEVGPGDRLSDLSLCREND